MSQVDVWSEQVHEIRLSDFRPIYSSELLSTKTKEFRINELEKKSASQQFFKKCTIYILYLIISLQKFLKS